MRAFLAASSLIAAGLICGRLLGLLREVQLAASFGTGAVADYGVLLLLIPDFVAAALIGGAASAVLIPAFAARSDAARSALFWQALAASVVISLPVALLLVPLVLPLASGQVAGAPSALMVSLLALPMSVATAVFSAWLQFKGKLVAPAFATVWFNAALMLVLYVSDASALAIGLGIAAGAFVRMASHLIALKNTGLAHPAHGEKQLDAPLLRAYASATGTSLLNMLPHYAPYLLLAGSGLATFNYAYKLLLLPAMLALTVISMLGLPWLSRQHQAGEGAFAASARGSLLAVGLLGWVLMLSLMQAAPHLAALCFGHGQMTAESLAHITFLFTLSLAGLPFMLLSGLWQQLFFARHEPNIPLRTTTKQIILLLPLCAAASWAYGAAGVICALVLVQVFGLFLLARHGLARGIVSGLMPASSSFAALAGSAALLSFAGFLAAPWSFSPLAGVAVYAIFGVLSLIVGVVLSTPLKDWIKTCSR